MIVHTFIVMLEAAASATATFLHFFVTSVADVSALKQSILCLCVCVCLGGGGTCTDVVYGTHLVTGHWAGRYTVLQCSTTRSVYSNTVLLYS